MYFLSMSHLQCFKTSRTYKIQLWFFAGLVQHVWGRLAKRMLSKQIHQLTRNLHVRTWRQRCQAHCKTRNLIKKQIKEKNILSLSTITKKFSMKYTIHTKRIYFNSLNQSHFPLSAKKSPYFQVWSPFYVNLKFGLSTMNMFKKNFGKEGKRIGGIWSLDRWYWTC